jgi:energy-converting hydrogenase Eha subunit G
MTATNASMASRFAQQIGRGRSLIIVVVTDVMLFVIANVAYGNGNDKHGPMRTLSNVVWVFFLIGFVILIVFAVAALVRVVARRAHQDQKAA